MTEDEIENTQNKLQKGFNKIASIHNIYEHKTSWPPATPTATGRLVKRKKVHGAGLEQTNNHRTK
jgi:hypothetical protein